MSQPQHSIEPTRGARRLAAFSALIGLSALLCGCAGMGVPFGPDHTDASLAAAGGASAVVPVKAETTGNPSDWEIVRSTLAKALVEKGGRLPLDWSNPTTGASGTISTEADGVAVRGSCHAFSTTLSDVRGVRLYRGEACRQADGGWRLQKVAPGDAALI